MNRETITTSKATIVLGETNKSLDDYLFDLAANGNLPKGESEVLGRAKDLTEGQWKEIVDQHKTAKFFEDVYYMDYIENAWRVFTATESGITLIESHGFSWENCFILKLK